jgi:hypothetical protein
MVRDKVAPLLAGEFVTLELDTDRTVGGKEVFERFKGTKDGGLPWFCVLEADGSVVADSVTPAGNLGCPWTDEEIAAFGAFLQKTTRKLDQTQLATLGAELRAYREESQKKRAAH